MKKIENVELYIAIIATSLFFLLIEHLTHFEVFMHLAAIPLEILAGVFIVEKFLEKRKNGEGNSCLLEVTCSGQRCGTFSLLILMHSNFPL